MTDEKKPGVTVVMNSNASSARMLMPGAAPIDIKDPIPDVPVVQGPHGRAWLCDRLAGLRKLKFDPAQDASLDHWMVEAPWAHPAWHSYSILLIHLREMPGEQKGATKFYIPDATHELMVYALNPEQDRRPLLATAIPDRHWMTPGNFAAQFIEITDDLARERVRNTVQMICDGKLSPDTDFTRDWVRLYNNSMIKKEYR
jgi:hypothetical protein